MNGMSLGELARMIDGELDGDPAILIQGIRGIESATAGSIAVVKEARFLSDAANSQASALVVAKNAAIARANVVRVSDVKRAFIRLLELFAQPAVVRHGIHPRATVAEGVTLGLDVYVGPGACIDPDVTIGDGAQVHANSFVGSGSTIGAGSVIHPNVTIYSGTSLGERVVIHSGSVIGSDGFGYVQNERGEHEKIPQIGGVVIEDDVEIGANCAIDRGTIESTRIRRGTKIDNLVQIGHNADIGEDCCIVGQAGVSGSVRIGRRTVLAGQAGIADHVTIGEHVTIGAQAGVHSDISSGVWFGSPALPYAKAVRLYGSLEHFPEYRDRVRALEKEIARLAERIENNGISREHVAVHDREHDA